MDTTGSTVIGAFTQLEDARRAVSQLHGAGFAANEVKLIPNEQDESLSSDQRTNVATSGSEHKGGIMNFFSHLFGFDDDQQATAQRSSQMNIDQDTQRYFSDQYQGKRHLVVVYSNAQRNQAISIIQSCGGLVEDRASLLYDQERMKGSTQRTSNQNLDSSQREVLRLSEEELIANKEVVQTGEVTLRKEVVTETKTIQVPVSREEIVIERHPVDGRDIAAADSTIGSESREIRIPVSEERVIVDKVVVPREEVRVSKQKVERTEEVTEDLRHEELEVNREGTVNLRGDEVTRDEDLTEEERLARRRRNKDADRSGGSRPYV